MPNDGYFDINRDNELIATGTHFWCEACLSAHPLDAQSPDHRYCLGCYAFLIKEAEMLRESGSRSRPKWLPVASPDTKRGIKKCGDTPTPIS